MGMILFVGVVVVGVIAYLLYQRWDAVRAALTLPRETFAPTGLLSEPPRTCPSLDDSDALPLKLPPAHVNLCQDSSEIFYAEDVVPTLPDKYRQVPLACSAAPHAVGTVIAPDSTVPHPEYPTILSTHVAALCDSSHEFAKRCPSACKKNGCGGSRPYQSCSNTAYAVENRKLNAKNLSPPITSEIKNLNPKKHKYKTEAAALSACQSKSACGAVLKTKKGKYVLLPTSVTDADA